MNRCGHIVRLSKDPRHVTLELRKSLGADTRGHVDGDSVVTEELTSRVEERLAAETDVLLLTR